jgi:hypothetical protein
MDAFHLGFDPHHGVVRLKKVEAASLTGGEQPASISRS